METENKKIKLAFLLDWVFDESSQLATLADGAFEAIRLLSEEWDISVHVNSNKGEGIFPHKYFPIHMTTEEKMADHILAEKPDVILVWADFTRPVLKKLVGRGVPMALMFSGGIGLGEPPKIDMFFVESEVYKTWFEMRGLPVMTAFGCNNRIFKPMKQPKIFDAIFPATFAGWKRHHLFAKATQGMKALACGYMYNDHETECWGLPQELGVAITPHLSNEAVNSFINMSHVVVVTSDSSGGSQRTVLEAMACGVPVIAMEDSDKTSEYVKESGFGMVVGPTIENIRGAIETLKANPLDPKIGIKYIQDKWSARRYADSLKAGIESIL